MGVVWCWAGAARCLVVSGMQHAMVGNPTEISDLNDTSSHIRPLATRGILFWLLWALTSQSITAAGIDACHKDCVTTGQQLAANTSGPRSEN